MCCNFTELTDKEFYATLKQANKTLMKNYYNKQQTAILEQIDYLYDTQDASFRGFRHNTGKSDRSVSKQDAFRNSRKNKPVNWENTLSKDSDGARFLSKDDGLFNSEKKHR